MADSTVVNIKPAAPKQRAPRGPSFSSKSVLEMLNTHQSRVYEARAILALIDSELTGRAGGVKGKRLEICIRAVNGAERLLKSVAGIYDPADLAEQAKADAICNGGRLSHD